MPRQRKVPDKLTALGVMYWRAPEAREVLDLWRRSGSSLTEFARQHGLCRQRLPRWRGRLAAEQAAPRFHPVRLVESADPRRTAALTSEAIEVVVLGGRRVAVRPGFDPDLLAGVVRVLESLGC